MFDFTPKTRCSARDANFTTASAPQTLKGTSLQAISRRANEKQNLFTRSGRRGAAAFDGPLPEEDKQLLICSLRNIQTFYSISSSVELQNSKTNREQSAEASLTPTLAFNEAKFHLRLWIFSSFQSHGRSNHRGAPSPSQHRSDMYILLRTWKTFSYRYYLKFSLVFLLCFFAFVLIISPVPRYPRSLSYFCVYSFTLLAPSPRTASLL